MIKPICKIKWACAHSLHKSIYEREWKHKWTSLLTKMTKPIYENIPIYENKWACAHSLRKSILEHKCIHK